MKARIIILIILAALIVGVGVFVWIDAGRDKFSDETAVAGYKLWIAESEGKCELVFRSERGEGRMPLGPKLPCRFLTEDQGKVQFYSYPDVDVIAVLIVIGSPAKPDQKTPKTLKKNWFCGEKSQGVVIRSDGVFVTQSDSGSILCTNQGADEKMFWFIAHEEELIGPKKTKDDR